MASETITGTVERITYFNEENGYSVVKIKPDKRLKDVQAADKEGLFTAVGNRPNAYAEEYCWQNHACPDGALSA